MVIMKIWRTLRTQSSFDHLSCILPAIAISCHDNNLWESGFEQCILVKLWLMTDSFCSSPSLSVLLWCLMSQPCPGLVPKLWPQAIISSQPETRTTWYKDGQVQATGHRDDYLLLCLQKYINYVIKSVEWVLVCCPLVAHCKRMHEEY